MIYLVIGPSASGKSDFAIKLANDKNASIINFDPFNFYKDMNIGTAKPSLEMQKKVNHYMIDFLKPNEKYSIYEFQKEARLLIKKLIKEDKNIVLVGGSGLYLNSVIFDYKFSKYEENKSIKFTSFEQKKEFLKQNDFLTYQNIDLNNERRVESAIKFYLNENKSKEKNKSNKLYFDQEIKTYYLRPSKEVLKKNITKRTQKMLENNYLIREIKMIINKYQINQDHQSQKAIGYKEYYELHKKNLFTKENFENQIIKNTLKLTKRQKTWFNNKTIKFLKDVIIYE